MDCGHVLKCCGHFLQGKTKWLQIHCYPSHFFTKLEELRTSISSIVLDILYATPFAHFFVVNKSVTMEKYILQDILDVYNVEENCFYISGCKIEIRSEDCCLMLGLPLVGNCLNLSKRPQYSQLRSRYFGKDGRPTRERLFSCAQEAIRNGDDENAARLLILFLFSTILFSAANSSTPPSLLDYVDDLSGLWAFKWGDEVFRYLLAGVRHVVTARRSGKSLVTLHGCSLVLLVSIYVS